MVNGEADDGKIRRYDDYNNDKLANTNVAN